MGEIASGAVVIVRTADGQQLRRRSVTGVVDGLDFPVVWVTTEQDWTTAEGNGGRPPALPWPAEDVELAEEASTS
jgi:hypothetical protein